MSNTNDALWNYDNCTNTAYVLVYLFLDIIKATNIFLEANQEKTYSVRKCENPLNMPGVRFFSLTPPVSFLQKRNDQNSSKK